MKLQPMGLKGRAPAHVRPWTPEEDALLIALYSSTPVKDIAARIKRTVWAVYNRTGVLRSSYPELLGSDSNLLIVFYVQIMPDDLVMQLHRF